eukprot:m.42730 g.42730  ORF g.42730 m.42730 type:complete len:183 (-) comp9905_c0_seq1:167-715(-)
MSVQLMVPKTKGKYDQFVPFQGDGSLAHLTTEKSSQARWTIIYPRYLDANVTIAEGRRVSKELAVDNPNFKEIGTVLDTKKCGLQWGIEQKMYPRDYPGLGRIRLRVCLFDKDGKPVNDQIKNKKALLHFIAKGIPNTDIRVEYEKKKRQAQEQQRQRQEAEEAAAAKAKQSQNKKKGKKKR